MKFMQEQQDQLQQIIHSFSIAQTSQQTPINHQPRSSSRFASGGLSMPPRQDGGPSAAPMDALALRPDPPPLKSLVCR